MWRTLKISRNLRKFVPSSKIWCGGHTISCCNNSTQLSKVAGNQGTHQPWINIETHWSSTFINFVSTWITGWRWKLSQCTWLKMKVEPMYIYRRCFNVGKTTLKKNLLELRRLSVNEPKLFERWNLVENESWAGGCLWMFFNRWHITIRKNYNLDCDYNRFILDDPMLFQFFIWFKRKVESMYLHRRWENSIEAMSIFFVPIFTRERLSKKNKTSFQA